MADESEQAADQPKAKDEGDRWTVRGVGQAERSAAKRMADKADQSVGEWLTQAIRDKIQADKAGTNVPAIVGRGPPVVADMQAFEMAERAADKLTAMAASGLPVSKTSASKVVSALTRQLSASGRRKMADTADTTVFCT